MINIDYVFPYVNDADPVWQEMAKKYWPERSWQPQRFRELGFLKYLFRGLAENLPWLNSIIMLVDFKSQVPEWLDIENTNIKVVTLDEFIPEKYLPTFNSNTIEMFLADIPNLSEYLIYGNDDFIPLNLIKPEDYFENNLPKISFKTMSKVNTTFRGQCKRNWDIVHNKLNSNILPKDLFHEQTHDPQAIRLSILKEASEFLKDERLKSITQRRDFSKNLSQYIYFNYALCTGQCISRMKYHVFKELKPKNLKIIQNTIESANVKWICLNDSSNTDLKIIDNIIESLDNKYTNKCKYER